MSFLDSITNNKTLVNMLLGQLKKAIEKEKINCIMITTDEKGDLDFTPYKEEMVIISKSDYTELQKLAVQ